MGRWIEMSFSGLLIQWLHWVVWVGRNGFQFVVKICILKTKLRHEFFGYKYILVPISKAFSSRASLIAMIFFQFYENYEYIHVYNQFKGYDVDIWSRIVCRVTAKNKELISLIVKLNTKTENVFKGVCRTSWIERSSQDESWVKWTYFIVGTGETVDHFFVIFLPKLLLYQN